MSLPLDDGTAPTLEALYPDHSPIFATVGHTEVEIFAARVQEMYRVIFKQGVSAADPLIQAARQGHTFGEMDLPAAVRACFQCLLARRPNCSISVRELRAFPA